jgi:hypothetical protein
MISLLISLFRVESNFIYPSNSTQDVSRNPFPDGEFPY